MRIRVFALCLFLGWLFIGVRPVAARDEPQYLELQVPSTLLRTFWKQPVAMFAHVLLPDSYYKEPQRRYPVLYWIQGFGGTGDIDLSDELAWQRPMRALHSEFIIVFLDGMFNGGHDEFADSANNGPWGAALTTEFIPQADAYFRTIPDAAHRFVGGHSSGGWSALWLQITYPQLFGAEWSLSPDPVDFRDFVGPDLTQFPPQNFYHDASGQAYRVAGQTLRDFVYGPGWEHRQMDSFNNVFSPRLADGTAASLFDKRSGVIDTAIQKYWDDHFDIAELLRTKWSTLGPQLHGKIHIIVGTGDEFGLDRSVKRFQQELQSLGGDAEIDYAAGANHQGVFGFHGSARGYVITEAAALLDRCSTKPVPAIVSHMRVTAWPTRPSRAASEWKSPTRWRRLRRSTE